MGGKHKVANRTKNNARPSSSGRSAELLGTSIPQFVGFSGIKESGFTLPGFSLAPHSEDLENSIDANFQLVFKKINKKDSTTKLKGLQEFADLVKNSDSEAVKAILPLWPRCYNCLATDTDNRVREAAHIVHHQIVLKAKRNLAPYLKQLMAPWFTSQYDTYPPAASVATKAFQDAFPPNKIHEAIVFCQEEILSYINENLLTQNAQTISSSKTVSPEEAEARYERVQISCLQGYFLYLTKVPTEQIEKVATSNNEIVSNSKFWKLGKNKFAPIRAAWFEVMTAILQKAKFLVSGKEKQIANAVFGNLDETEPTVLPYVWESTLLIMSSVTDWWNYIDVDKLFLPKLWKILKQGGQGNSVVICPNLLPLLSHLPPTLCNSTFYNTYFENLRTGLKQKTVVTSRSESVAVATALIECLQYIMLKNQADFPLCEELIKNHIFTTVKWCLVENQACHKTIFNQIASLVQYWSRNCKQAELENYTKLLKYFFENVNLIFYETLHFSKDYKPTNVAEIATKQIELLQCLKHTAKPKKQLKVTFTTNELEAPNVIDENCDNLQTNDSYMESLNEVVFSTCEIYVKCIEEKQSKELLEHLCSLVKDFNTKIFFSKLSTKLKKEKDETNLINIYNVLLQKWLKSSYLCSKYVVDLIFLLFNYITDGEKREVLKALSEVSNKDCLGWCIAEALAHPHITDPLIQEWLQNEKVSDFLVSIAEKEISDECPSELSVLFKLALTENSDGGLYIHKEAVAKIIQKLIATLEHDNEFSVTLDTCSSLAAYLSAVIYTETLLLNYNDTLLLALFRLSCKTKLDPEIISTETLWEVSTAWQDAVTILSKGLSKDEFKTLTFKLADIIEEEFFNINLESKNLDHLSNVITGFLKASYKSVPLLTSDLLNIFIERSFVSSWTYHITELCKISEYIKGDLCSPYEEITYRYDDFDESNILKFLTWSYLKISIISSNVMDQDNYVDSEEEEEDEKTADTDNSTILNVIDYREELISNLVYNLGVAACFLDNYKNTKYYESFSKFYGQTKSKITITVQKLDNTFKNTLKSLFKEKVNKEYWFWCKAVYLFYKEILPTSLIEVFEEFVENTSTEKNLGVLHLVQIFGKHLNFDFVQKKVDTVGSVVILRSLLHCEDIDVQIAEVFGKVEAIRNENVPQFLYNSTSISWSKTQEIIEIVRLCADLTEHKFTSLNRRHWDFGMLSLVSWSSNCLKARNFYEKYQVQALITSVVKLFVSTDKQVQRLKEENSNSNFVSEWNDLFVESIHADILQIWMYLSEQLESKQQNELLPYLPLIQEFGLIMSHINHTFIFKINDNSMPKWTKFLKRSCSLLISPLPTLQIWGYKMLLVLVPGLVEIDNEAVNTNTPHKKGLIFEQFKEKLLETHEIVNTMLLGFKLGEDSCQVKPSTDSFTYTFAYLLLWDILLTLCDHSAAELRFQYADWLRNEELLQNFLNNLFRLMPTEILHCNEGKSRPYLDSFLNKPALNVTDTCNCEKIESLVCWLYASTLAQLPALVRQWWTGLDSRVAQIVEKVTSVYVSPRLCVQELNDVAQHQVKFKNMVIKVVPAVREVIAIYTVDEAQMELVITLPSNYPLGGPDVQCNRQIGGTTHKTWLLQLKKCVLHQNGRIWDGLSLWNNNLDKKFDGVEECYICFAVLHPGTYQLPKLSCQTCKKKFHSACLYKWFSTSNKSSCPICRNLF